MTAITIDHVSRSFGTVRAVDDVSLEIRDGEFFTLLGPSGCGKTTLLRTIAGFADLTAGQIRFGERRIDTLPPHRRNTGMVFQNYAIFPNLTVGGNVAYGLKARSVPEAQMRERVARALKLVHLDGYEERWPHQLSGGQLQRVAIARCLVIEPEVLLLDEPLSNLDAKLREEMRGEIREIQRRLGITTVFVTHDQAEALALADRIAVMERGRLAQLGSPEEVYERPATPFVARFVGRINALSAAAGGDGRLRIGGQPVPAGDLRPAGARATVMIRPQHITLSQPGTSLPARVTGITYVGDVVQIAVAGDGFSIVAERGTADSSWRGIAVGQDVGVGWPAASALVFSEAADGR